LRQMPMRALAARDVELRSIEKGDSLALS
jgi:hypothetical protein